jgi:hypothetical protein
MDDTAVTAKELQQRAIEIISNTSFEAFDFTQDDQLLLSDALEFKCDTKDRYRIGAQMFKDLGALVKRIERFYEGPKKPLRDLKQIFQDMQNRDVKEPLDARDVVGTAITDWKKEQDRLDKIERDRLQAEADKRANEERAARLKELQDKAAAAAKENPAVSKMFEAQVTAIESMPAVAPQVDAPSSVPTVRGLSFTKRWYGRVDDVKCILQAFIDGSAPIPEELLIEAIEKHLNDVAPSLRNNLGNVYPGCSAYESESPVGRGGK